MQHESGQLGSNAAAPVQPPIIITSCQRDPPSFSGLRGEDVEDWLDQFNRVSAFNRWDDTFKRRNVSVSLHEVAKTWFLNNEADIPDWTTFVEELRKIFGTPTGSAAAKKKLAARVQHPYETFCSYIEDVIALCRRADKDMSETDKVHHVMKGISSFAFNALAVQNPTTIADVRTICQRLDRLQSNRIQEDCLPTGSFSDSELRTLIRTIIREELQQRDGTCLQNADAHTHGLRDLIKQELACMTAVEQPGRPAPLHAQSYSQAVTRPTLPMEPIAPRLTMATCPLFRHLCLHHLPFLRGEQAGQRVNNQCATIVAYEGTFLVFAGDDSWTSAEVTHHTNATPTSATPLVNASTRHLRANVFLLGMLPTSLLTRAWLDVALLRPTVALHRPCARPLTLVRTVRKTRCGSFWE